MKTMCLRICAVACLAVIGCGEQAMTATNEQSPPEDGATTKDAASPDAGKLEMDASGASDQSSPDAEICGSVTFELTLTQELLTVPANVTHLYVKAWGAGGNGEGQCAFDDSGLGGYSEAVFQISPGTPLVVIVGQKGRAGMTGEEIIKFGFGNWGGGGLSGVFIGADPINDASTDRALIIAGGGGGASAPDCHPGGTGNHPSAGGQPTMQGGAGVDDVNGGGGGYIGGTGGAHLVGGLGGTGFVKDIALPEYTKLLYAEPGAGKPPNTDDPDYDGLAGQGERNGLVVMHFTCGPPVIY